MIKRLYSKIPWEKNLRLHRQAVAFSLQLENQYSIDTAFGQALSKCLVDVDFEQFSKGEEKDEIVRLLDEVKTTEHQPYFFDLLMTGPQIEKSSSVRFLGWGSEPNSKRDGISIVLPHGELSLQHCQSIIRALDASKFNLGFFYDADYVKLQSRHNVSMYKYTGGLKKCWYLAVGAGRY